MCYGVVYYTVCTRYMITVVLAWYYADIHSGCSLVMQYYSSQDIEMAGQ